jgi:hypothetical protein
VLRTKKQITYVNSLSFTNNIPLYTICIPFGFYVPQCDDAEPTRRGGEATKVVLLAAAREDFALGRGGCDLKVRGEWRVSFVGAGHF